MPFRIAFPRKYAVALSAVAAIALPGSALAVGGIVFDPTNYVQAIKQVQAWEQQYRQMTQSLQKAEATFQQAKAQVDALTGVRGFGDLINNPMLRNIVPADLSTTLADLNQTGVLSGRAATIRSNTAIYDCSDLSSGGAKTVCQALLAQNAQAQAVQQDTMALLNQRTTQIEALRAEINQTQDPKAIAELQARLEVETAQVANDQNKIAVSNAMLAANRAAAAQAEVERVNALMATNKTSVLDNFSFTRVGYQPSSQVAEVEQ